MPIQIEVPGQGIVEFPDGMTDSQIESAIKSNSQPEQLERSDGINWTKSTENILRQTALAGKAAYKGLTSIPTIAGEAVALPYNLAARGLNLPESHPSRAISSIGESLYPNITPETQEERLSQDVISSVGSAGGMMSLGRSIAPMIGTTGRVGQTLMANPAMQTAGAATSGLASGATREAGGGELSQMLAGITGGLSPTIGLKAYDLTRMVASPAYKSIAVLGKQGKKVESEDILRKLAENEPVQIQTALARRSTYVQGQPPTSAEALAQYKKQTGETIGTGLVKLQNTLKQLPEASNKLQTIDTKRLESYGNVIGKIAGSEAKMDALIKARVAATQKLYEQADNYQTPVDNKVIDLISRIPSKAMADAKEMAQLDGSKLIGIDESGLSSNVVGLNGKSLKYLIKGLDARANDINVDSGVRASSRKLSEELYSVLEKTNPFAVKADRLYAEYSNPINRMQVGKILSDKLQNASLADTPGAFLTAADDAAKTIKTATKMTGYKSFQDIMSPKEINAIKAVSKDMERMLEAGRIASKSTLPSAGKLGEAAQFNVPSLLSRPVAFTKWILASIGKDISPEINKIMADTLADPQKLAIVLKNAPKDQIPKLMEYANQFRTGAVSGIAPIQQGQQQ